MGRITNATPLCPRLCDHPSHGAFCVSWERLGRGSHRSPLPAAPISSLPPARGLHSVEGTWEVQQSPRMCFSRRRAVACPPGVARDRTVAPHERARLVPGARPPTDTKRGNTWPAALLPGPSGAPVPGLSQQTCHLHEVSEFTSTLLERPQYQWSCPRQFKSGKPSNQTSAFRKGAGTLRPFSFPPVSKPSQGCNLAFVPLSRSPTSSRRGGLRGRHCLVLTWIPSVSLRTPT